MLVCVCVGVGGGGGGADVSMGLIRCLHATPAKPARLALPPSLPPPLQADPTLGGFPLAQRPPAVPGRLRLTGEAVAGTGLLSLGRRRGCRATCGVMSARPPACLHMPARPPACPPPDCPPTLPPLLLMQEDAAHAYDLAALACKGPSAPINFSPEDYSEQLREIDGYTRVCVFPVLCESGRYHTTARRHATASLPGAMLANRCVTHADGHDLPLDTGRGGGVRAPPLVRLQPRQEPLPGGVGARWALGGAHRLLWRPQEREGRGGRCRAGEEGCRSSTRRRWEVGRRRRRGHTQECSPACWACCPCHATSLSASTYPPPPGPLQVSFGVFDSEKGAARQYDRALILEKASRAALA